MRSPIVILAVLVATRADARGSPRSSRSGAFLATDAPSRLALLFSKAAKSLNSPELTMLAEESATATKDPDALAKVKEMIAHMLANKMDQHASMATHDGFCTSEMTNSEKRVGDLQHQVDKNSADTDMIVAVMAQSKDKISDLTSSIASETKRLSHAVDVRNADTAKDADPGQPDESFQQRLAEKSVLAKEEMEAQEVQAKLDKSIERMQSEVDKLNHDIVKKNVDFQNLKRDSRSYKEQLGLAKKYAETIHSQCIVRSDDGEERRERRLEEVDTLKEAHEILSGDAIP